LINQLIRIYMAPHRPFKIPTQKRSWPMTSGKERSWEGGEIENRHRLGDALDLFENLSIPRCWTNHRKITGLHCSRAGKWGHQIIMDNGHRTTVYDLTYDIIQ